MNSFAFFRSLRVCLWILVFSPICGAQDFPTTDGDLEAKFQRAFGSFVGPSKLAKSQELTGKISTELAKALKGYLRDNYDRSPSIQFETKIFESKEFNAMIVPELSADKKTVSAKVFVSSAVYDTIAQKVASLPEPEATHESIRMLSGVLAHEFAHVIDKFDPRGIENSLGRQKSSQGIEVRTDFEATDLLERAGLPRDSTYAFLNHLAKVDMPAALRLIPFGKSYLQTHPEMNLRQTLNRAFLTLRRYAKGLAWPLNKENFQRQLPSALQELSHTPLKETLGQEIATFTSHQQHVSSDAEFHEKLATFEASLPEVWAPEFRIKIHSELTSLLLAARSRAHLLTPSDKDHIFEAVKNYYAADPDNGVKEMHKSEEALRTRYLRSTWDRNSTEKNLTLSTESPAEILKTLNFYQDPAYVAKVKALAQQSVTKEINSILPLTEHLGCFLPRESVYSSAREMFLERIKLLNPSNTSTVAHAIRNFYDNFSREDKTRFATDLMKNVLAHSFHNFEIEMIELNSGWGSSVGILGTSASARSEAITPQTMKEFSDFVWQNRAKLAFIDLHGGPLGSLDWESVFKAQNLSIEQGYRELNKSMQDLIVSPEYLTLMRNFKSKFQRRVEGRSSISPTGRAWVNVDTFRAMTRAVHNPEMRQTQLPEQLTLLADYYPETYRELYGAQIKEYLNKGGYIAGSHPEQLVENAFITMNKRIGFYPSKYLPPAYDLLAEAIDTSNLSPEHKRAALKESFFDASLSDHAVSLGEGGHSVPNAVNWWTDLSFAGSRRVYAVLKKHGIIQNYPEFLTTMRGNNYALWEAKPNWLFASLSKFSPDFQSEIQALLQSPMSNAEKISQLDKMLADTFGNYTGKELLPFNWGTNLGHDPQIKALQKVFLEAFESLGIALQHRLKVLDRLTTYGPSEATDQFLIKLVKDSPPDHFVDKKGKSPLRNFLKNNRVHNPLIEVDLGQHFLEADLKEIRTPVLKEDLLKFLREVDAILPNPSRAKDAYLERVAWSLKTLDLDLLKIIEEHKSTNWRSHNAKIVNSMSELADSIVDFMPDERLAAIDYLIDPQSQQVPKAIEQAFHRVANQRLNTRLSEATTDKLVNSPEVQDRKQLMLDKFQLFAQNSNTEERTPVIDLLLTATPNALMEADSAAIPERILNHFFAGQRHDKKFLGVLSFLESVDSNERSPSLSYMLSQRREGAEDIVSAYQTFDSVGIKGAQLASITEMYSDPESNRKLAKLKDRARPMSKYEIMRELRKSLTNEEYARIEDVPHILGSASIKVVVEVKLRGQPDPVVAVIARPDANAIIEGHLEVADRFIRRLKANDLHEQAEEYEIWLKPIRKQLALETDLRSEKVQLENAEKLAVKMNHELGPKLENWKFRVPKLIEGFTVRKNILFMDKIPGQSVEQLKSSNQLNSTHQVALKGTARAWLKGLYEFGFANGDLHFGNVLLDEASHTIGLIDQGQGEVFSLNPSSTAAHDDIEKLANFLYAASRQDAADLVKWGIGMSHEGSLSEPQQHSLKAAIIAAFEQKALSPSQRVRKIIQAFHQAGLELDKKFVLSAMKGSLIVQREGYLTPGEFESALKEEVGSVLVRRKLRSITGIKVKEPCNFANYAP